MTQVTVDSDDLEALVFGTGVIKNIEGSLAAFKRDPFTKTNVPLTEAHDRLASAMRNAKRAQADTLVKWDEPLTKDEQIALAAVAASCKEMGDVKRISPKDKAPDRGEAMSIYDRLAAKGIIEMGQFLIGIMWAGQQSPAITAQPEFAARLTPRGRSMLEQIKASNQKRS
jgi:hypothetical protein